MLSRTPSLLFIGLAAFACAGASAPPIEHQERVDAAERALQDDPLVQAHLAAVHAAQANERRPEILEEVELRVGDDYLDDEHQLRTIARLKLQHPSALRAEREVLRAETELEISRLEEVSLERRVALCFPSVEAQARDERRAIFDDYARRQQELLDWNRELRASGVIDELTGARFELSSRTKLALRRVPRTIEQPRVAVRLPGIGGRGQGKLDRSSELVRSKVQAHHPSVAVQLASAERHAKRAEQARAQGLPGLEFFDIAYEHRTDRSQEGVGGQLGFSIPFGGRANASVARFHALERQQRSKAMAIVGDQISLALQALDQAHDFEDRAAEWSALEQLAANAEEMAERWRTARSAAPARVEALLDDAYQARIAVLEARELAARAGCALLGTTGVTLEAWPRE